jgi:hypothetical protein
MIKHPIAWVVIEAYKNDDFRNAPNGWNVIEVFEQDQVGSCLFLRDGEVIVMQDETDPESHPDQIIFELTIDGEPDGDEKSTWVAFSTLERAESWIKEQQKRSAA